ncbi:DUF3536 domain-containing protein [bacterium]|nr:DUF3536 domain-containing protein [bacterium]
MADGTNNGSNGSGADGALTKGHVDVSDRFLCVHGHFYQPPRENPWLETIEEQPTAAPFHDWNDRITNECYGPNTAARVVNSEGEILDIRNNYEKISFNIGPTLLSWMEHHAEDIYHEILAADARSVVERGGHGNALGQVYNHLIMPLASRREKNTQIIWGMEDFRRRFRRDPEGFWLSETAVDVETLEVLAANGVVYTVLAPRQAKAFRVLDGTGGWRSADGGRIDPSRPYICSLPSGRHIVLFFYDGPISQAVAFEGLLTDGNRFAERLTSGFSRHRTWPQLVHIATDGESYGHHHLHGEMALAYALHVIEARSQARLTNYGEYLSLVAPNCEAQIWENSSWSCVHGVERWRSDCGCSTGGHQGWNQKWRRPLRDAFDLIKAKADEIFDVEAARFFREPWEARDAYIDVLLNRTPDQTFDFLSQHKEHDLEPEERREALSLLEMQRNSMLMYTSCAWFFDELSGIETVQTLKYAARLLQLIQRYAPKLEAEFVAVLEKAPSNIPAFENGRAIWHRLVKPQVVDLHRVVANYAILNFDRHFEGSIEHYCYEINESDSHSGQYGNSRLKISRFTAASRLAGETLEGVVCVLHFGGHDFQCKIRGPLDLADYEDLQSDLFKIFSRRSLTEVVRAIDAHFGGRDYTLSDLFGECQREILGRVTVGAFERFESTLNLMYDENRKLMEYLLESGAPLPPGFLAVGEYVLRARLKDELAVFVSNPEQSTALETAKEARHIGLNIVDEGLRGDLARALEQVFHDLALMPTGGLCRIANQLLDIIEILDVHLDLWEAQNICFALVYGRDLPSHLARQTRYRRRPNSPVFPALRELADRLRISRTPLRSASDIEEASMSG